jgi:dTDP-4-amino-4,6-dideoxygalactose transaminase
VKFEQALCDCLGVEHIAVFAHGTIALVTALQALSSCCVSARSENPESRERDRSRRVD